MLRMTEVIKDVLPGRPVAALSGPNLAKEIMAGQAAASVVATHDLEVAAALQAIFQSGLFRVYINHDVVGVEMGGALKNVIAPSLLAWPKGSVLETTTRFGRHCPGPG